MKIVTTAQMIDLDKRTIHEGGISGKKLVEQAGKAAADWTTARYKSSEWRVLVLVGKGNNGADAKVVARCLKKEGFPVRIFKGWKERELSSFQLEIHRPFNPKSRVLVVDGLFGTGLNRSLKEPVFSTIEALRSTKVHTISLDLPSGLHADTGRKHGMCVRADHTLTFGLPKLGLVQEHAADDVGELHVLDIGFPSEFVQEIRTPYHLVTKESLRNVFQMRPRNSHKGDFGHVLIVGGCKGMVGAPTLAARAALRAGAGLVTMIVPASLHATAACLAGPEVMVHPIGDPGDTHFSRKSISKIKQLFVSANSIVLGPGIGRKLETEHFIQEFIPLSPVSMVIDADALHLISKQPSILRKTRQDVIITPHPGEMGRLVGSTARHVQQKRFEVSETFAKKAKVTVVLKGSRTVIAHPTLFRPSCDFENGEFRYSVNALAGNPGMATAGCGDVLSGIIGALLARDVSTSEAAIAGVYLHARAGDLAMPSTGGGIATDLIEALPAAYETLCE